MKKVKKRNIFLFLLLNCVTLGIYGIVALCIMSKEINETCEGDGKKTMLYVWACLLGLVTLGIFPLIWYYEAMERLRDNGYRYDIDVKHSGSEFILWFIFGSLIVVGPIIAMCYFVADLNQFSDWVGVIPAGRYSSNPIERMQITQKIRQDILDINKMPPDPDPYQDQGVGTIYTKDEGTISWIAGDYSGCSFPVKPNQEVIIGRDPSVANIVIDQRFTTVSKKHCGVKFDPVQQYYTLTDYSSNGTIINHNNKLDANRPYVLECGSVVTIGNGENSFRLD